MNSHIKACVKKAIDEGIIRVDFTRNAIKTGRKGKRKEEKYLSNKESEKLYEYLLYNLDNSINYYLLLLELVTGMRFAEIVGLTRKDFNFVHNTINIDKSWKYTGKMHESFGATILTQVFIYIKRRLYIM